LIEKTDFMKFWTWFFKGSGNRSGFRKLFDRWFFFHVIIGFIFSCFIPVDLNTAANSVLLPLVGILVGLTFAWAGNAQALLQSPEISEFAEYSKGGFVDYVFTYQLAILVILITIVIWALAGLEVFDKVWPKDRYSTEYFITSLILYLILSLTLRECWHVVLGAQFMIMAQRKIKKLKYIKKNKLRMPYGRKSSRN